jgi:adenylyltransferase/sulfurtransferase
MFLVDVREPAEWEIVRIPDAVLIPKNDLPSRLAELPQDKPVVLYCKTGVRSAEGLALLKSAGFSDAKHVHGGVTAWQTQVLGEAPLY